MTDKDERGESVEEVQQPDSPTPTPTQDSPLTSSKGEPKTRSLHEIYEVTDEIPLLCLYAGCEPLFEEAIKSKEWRQAIDEEIKLIEKNDTWELTTLPKGQKAIGVKCVYKAKKNTKGEVEKYKQMDEGIFICQERYAKEILKRFDMDKCNHVVTLLEPKAKPSKHDGGKKTIDDKYVKGFFEYLKTGIVPTLKEKRRRRRRRMYLDDDAFDVCDGNACVPKLVRIFCQ
nr:retrovirus-related Pol polyprotein from transposon TNT 1-94 [Tanacetum cinerariifolium]